MIKVTIESLDSGYVLTYHDTRSIPTVMHGLAFSTLEETINKLQLVLGKSEPVSLSLPLNDKHPNINNLTALDVGTKIKIKDYECLMKNDYGIPPEELECYSDKYAKITAIREEYFPICYKIDVDFGKRNWNHDQFDIVK